MRAATLLILAISISLEIASIHHLLAPGGSAVDVALLVLLHGGASLSAALMLSRAMPPRFAGHRRSAAAAFFPVAFMIPILGIAGIATAVLLTLRLPPRDERVAGWGVTTIPDLPMQPFRVSAQPIYFAVGLLGVLRHAQDSGLRLRAVMATRQMSDQNAIPVLNVALKDPSDDVRLLAYAMLDGKERQIYSRIKERAARLERLQSAEGPSQTEVVAIRRQLAHDFWELAYLRLAQGEVLKHVLRQAMDHVEAVLAETPTDPGAHFLRGRLLLRRGEAAAAEEAIEKARHLGLPARTALPYLAEAAFSQRRFAEVRTRMAELGRRAEERIPLALVARYWLGTVARPGATSEGVTGEQSPATTEP